MEATMFDRMIGPGNIPEASVVLKCGVHWIRYCFEQHLRETHRRVYPSGANCLLAMSREELMTEAETPRDRAASSKVKALIFNSRTSEGGGRQVFLPATTPALTQAC